MQLIFGKVLYSTVTKLHFKQLIQTATNKGTFHSITHLHLPCYRPNVSLFVKLCYGNNTSETLCLPIRWGLQCETYSFCLLIAAFAGWQIAERTECRLLCLQCAVYIASYAICLSPVHGSSAECFWLCVTRNVKLSRPRTDLDRWATNTNKNCVYVHTSFQATRDSPAATLRLLMYIFIF